MSTPDRMITARHCQIGVSLASRRTAGTEISRWTNAIFRPICLVGSLQVMMEGIFWWFAS